MCSTRVSPAQTLPHSLSLSFLSNRCITPSTLFFSVSRSQTRSASSCLLFGAADDQLATDTHALFLSLLQDVRSYSSASASNPTSSTYSSPKSNADTADDPQTTQDSEVVACFGFPQCLSPLAAPTLLDPLAPWLVLSFSRILLLSFSRESLVLSFSHSLVLSSSRPLVPLFPRSLAGSLRHDPLICSGPFLTLMWSPSFSSDINPSKWYQSFPLCAGVSALPAKLLPPPSALYKWAEPWYSSNPQALQIRSAAIVPGYKHLGGFKAEKLLHH
eukprot:2406844-Rhodomonas_salina.1